MQSAALARLTKVDLREVFATEAGDFTPWLAQEENLKLLGETIGLSLELEAQEKNVGPFRADILCKETSDNTWVLIENQIEPTDHTHLGQLLTYAAGLKAVTIIWIAEEFTEQHRAALDWLNEFTKERIDFFGLEIELWKINDSPAAPKFNVVCKPNDWARSVQDGARDTGRLSDLQQLQLRFWTKFREYMERSKSPVRCQTPRPQHWMDHALGRGGMYLESGISSWRADTDIKEPRLWVSVVIATEQAKQHFALLEKQRESIEKAIGAPLFWNNPENKKSCSVYIQKPENFLDETLWAQQHQWLKEKLELFRTVFAPIVRNLHVPDEDKAAAANA